MNRYKVTDLPFKFMEVKRKIDNNEKIIIEMPKFVNKFLGIKEDNLDKYPAVKEMHDIFFENEEFLSSVACELGDIVMEETWKDRYPDDEMYDGAGIYTNKAAAEFAMIFDDIQKFTAEEIFRHPNKDLEDIKQYVHKHYPKGTHY